MTGSWAALGQKAVAIFMSLNLDIIHGGEAAEEIVDSITPESKRLGRYLSSRHEAVLTSKAALFHRLYRKLQLARCCFSLMQTAETEASMKPSRTFRVEYHNLGT
jgi:hypothetical protein